MRKIVLITINKYINYYTNLKNTHVCICFLYHFPFLGIKLRGRNCLMCVKTVMLWKCPLNFLL